MKLLRLFTAHPLSVNETYIQHLFQAWRYSLWLWWAGTACFIHAIFPFLFAKTASNCFLNLTTDLIRRAPAFEKRFSPLHDCLAEKNKTNEY